VQIVVNHSVCEKYHVSLICSLCWECFSHYWEVLISVED